MWIATIFGLNPKQTKKQNKKKKTFAQKNFTLLTKGGNTDNCSLRCHDARGWGEAVFAVSR